MAERNLRRGGAFDLFLQCVVGVAMLAGFAAPVFSAPLIDVDTSAIEFSPPSIMVGRTRDILRRIRNTGADPLKVVINILGPDASDFVSTLCLPDTLPPGGFCDVQVNFRPTLAGTRSAALEIRSNDSTTPVIDIPLTGTGLSAGPRIAVSPASLSFGLQPFAIASDPQRVTASNTGTALLTISSVTVDNNDFAVDQGCTLAPIGTPGFTDSMCLIDVRFTPSIGGPRSGTLTIVSDDPNGPVTLALLGMGPAAEMSVAPASFSFGSVEIGSTGTRRQIMVNNTGSAPLSVTSVTPTGMNAIDFAVRTALPCVAPTNGKCTVDVEFSPHGFGNRTGQFVVISNIAGAPPATVDVRGFGELAPLTPPAPLPADDHRFVAVASPTICVETGQSLAIPIGVTRVIGSRGTALGVAAGTILPSATLELMVLDTVSTGLHQVSVNGTSVGVINAASGGWGLRTLTMPISVVSFPPKAAPGSAPTPAVNTVTIAPDVTRVGRCVVVAWARLSFFAVSPVILVHGNGSNGAFFVRRGFVGALDNAAIANDASINLAVATGGSASIATNAMTLQCLVPGIVRSFGVNSVHLVAHSKGGLDARSWLSTFGVANVLPSATPAGCPGGPVNPGFRVLSLTTLSTPHQGSALADLSVAVDATGVGLFGFTVANLRSLGLAGPAMADLTTFAASAFNPPLPSAADYRMLGADVDRSGNGSADSAPIDEYLAARLENATLTGIFTGPPVVIGGVTVTGPQASDAIVTALYQTLRNTRAVAISTVVIVIPTPIVPGLEFIPPLPVVVTVTAPVPIFSGPFPNDLLVTIPSATGAPRPFIPAFGTTLFTGAGAREHASIANGGVTAAVIPFLITTDLTRGDLR